jgi:ADP-ribose pyrophosphatase
MRLKEKTIKVNYIYQGKILNLRRDDVELDNKTITSREFVEHQASVAVVAIQGDYVWMVKQFRYPYLLSVLEIPAGKLEIGETPEQAGLRELREETGIITNALTSLGCIYPSPGYTNEVIYLYLTNDFVLGDIQLDENEILSLEKVRLSKAYQMINDGTIKDAKTIIALLKYKLLG